MREDRFSGKVAIITGSTSGIGEAIAKEFAREGAKVIVSGRRTERGNAVVADIKAVGGEGTFVQADVAQMEECKNLIRSTIDIYGAVDILVNNAGIGRRPISIEEIPIEDWEDVIATNLMSVVHCSQAAIPFMKKKREGRIINISSLSSLRSGKTVSPCYGVSKAAINSYTRYAAQWLGEYNITVNSIAPGFIDTDMTKDGLLDATTVPLGKKYGTVDDVSNTVMFLASDDAKYITGTLIDVNGGVYMR
jgi:3-oxoacyl-[acyl-carrier protein] reductase